MVKNASKDRRVTSSSGTSPLPQQIGATQHSQPGALPLQIPPLPPATAPPSSMVEVAKNKPTGENIFYEPPGGTRRSYRSKVWEHFTSYWVRTVRKVKNEQTKTYEDVVEYKERAKCKYCPKNMGDFAADSGPNGTGGLNKHIPKRCKWYPANADLSKQRILTGEKGDYSQLIARGFNQKDTMEACVEMVVIDELPFSFVEKKGFIKFCMTGMPLFKIPSRRTLVRLFLEMYEAKKKKLRRELASHRVCLTTDTWTSVQNCNYMVLTAHFIDSNWKMHKRVLNFCVISNHQGVTISHLLEECLNEWGVKKVLTITVDNASSNKTALNLLAAKLNEDNETLLGGKHMHMRCVAHITNHLVGSGIKKLNPSIIAIRNAVRFVRSSPNRLEYFKKAVRRERLSFKGLCCLDVPTRWNSTYVMLDSAFKLQRAFKRMEQDSDSPYVAYFKEPDEEFDEEGNVIVQKKGKKVGPPSNADWEVCETFVGFLRVFYDVTLRVSASLVPTIHTTFHDIVQMEEVLNRQFAGLQSGDRLMAEVISLMKIKYFKYFCKLNELNPYIIMGLVLDPRFKLNHVIEILHEDLHWTSYEVEQKEVEIKQFMFDLYEEYADKNNLKKRKSGSSSSNINVKRQRFTLNERDVSGRVNSSTLGLKYVMRWSKRVEETDQAVIEHEIDRYLRDKVLAIRTKLDVEGSCTPRETITEPSAEDLAEHYRSFDLLQWWKVSASQYPVLALMAKDIFAIQCSTVASESAFSTSGRVIDAFRSSLTPQSVEALICMQNWLKGDDINMDFEDEPTVGELEFYENIEAEIRNAKATTSSSNSNSGGHCDSVAEDLDDHDEMIEFNDESDGDDGTRPVGENL